MAAPKGNQFWKLRSRHGRDKIFATPDVLWKEACKYFTWVDNNPLIESVVQKRKISRDEEIIELVNCPKKRPYTLHALCLFLDVNTVYFNHFEADLAKKNDQISKDFNKVITRIRETIYSQKFEGAASGFFNANIISRDLGLQDNKKVDIQTEQPLFELPDKG